MTPWIVTYSGLIVNPFDLKPEEIRIEDIAHHLACQTRWVGATRDPISTAQHSYCVMRLCEPLGPKIAMQALLHDAPEAYLGDVSKWIKAQPEMKGYRDAEDRAWNVICGVFDLDTELHPEVERADKVMASFEAAQGLECVYQWFQKSGYKPVNEIDRGLIGHWWFWGWRVSQTVFLQEFTRLLQETRV